MRPVSKISLRCYAKVNLGLRVIGVRADRYHELRTVFQTVSLFDTLDVSRTRVRGIQFECDVPEIAGPENLVVRAAQAIMKELSFAGGIHIRLRKRIPMGAGLGGGSSDAAAALRAVCRLAGVGGRTADGRDGDRPAVPGRAPSPERLLEIAAELGADVPFFLLGGTALGLGRGTEVYALPEVSRTWMVLAHPGVHVNTAEAYRQLDAASSLTDSPETDKIHRFCAEAWDVRVARPNLVNDFEPVVFAHYPQIARLKKYMVRAGVSPHMAAMSGSGSSVFGLCESRVEAQQVSKAVQLKFPDSRVWVLRTVRRSEILSKGMG